MPMMMNMVMLTLMLMLLAANDDDSDDNDDEGLTLCSRWACSSLLPCHQDALQAYHLDGRWLNIIWRKIMDLCENDYKRVHNSLGPK